MRFAIYIQKKTSKTNNINDAMFVFEVPSEEKLFEKWKEYLNLFKGYLYCVWDISMNQKIISGKYKVSDLKKYECLTF